MIRAFIFALLFVSLFMNGLAQERPELILQKGHSSQRYVLTIGIDHQGNLISAGEDGTVKVWDRSTETVMSTIYDQDSYPNQEDTGTLKSCALDPKGKWIATIDQANTLRRFSLPEGRLLNKKDLSNNKRDLLLTDGANLFTYFDGRLVKLDFDGEILAEAQPFSWGEEPYLAAIGGDQIALAGITGVQTYNLADLEEKSFRPLNSMPVGLAYDSAGQQLAVSTSSAAAILSADDLEIERLFQRDDFKDRRYVPFWAGNELYLIQRRSSPAPLLRAAESSTELEVLPVSVNTYSPVCLADGVAIVSAPASVIHELELATAQIKTTYKGDNSRFSAAAIDPITGDLITGSPGGQVVRWSQVTGRPARVYGSTGHYVGSLDISSDGKLLAGDASSGDVLCWDRTGTLLSKHSFNTNSIGDGVKQVKFAGDSRYVVTCGSGRQRIHLIECLTGRIVHSWEGKPQGLAVSPDGTRMAVGLPGSLLETSLTNPRDELVFPVRTHYPVRAMRYAPSGRFLYIGTEMGDLFGYDLTKPDSKPVHLTSLNGEILGVDLTPEGQLECALQNRTFVTLDTSGKTLSVSKPLEELPWYYPVAPQSSPMVVLSAGTVAFVARDTGRVKGRLVGVRDNSGWVAMARNGQFDGNDVGLETVKISLGDQLYGIEQFMNEYLRAGVLAELLPSPTGSSSPVSNSRAPELTAATAKRPPKVEIVSPTSGSILTGKTEVTVKVSDQGDGVSEVALFHNGHKLTPTARRQLDSSTYLFTVEPVQGVNEFRATAFEAAHKVEARQDRVKVHAPDIQARPPQLHLLAVGVDSYSSGLSLRFAKGDAQAVAGLFRSDLYQQGQRVLLSDAQATGSQIEAALGKIAGIAQPQDAFVFYLAGHGTVIGEEYYFLPHDVQIDSDDTVRTTAISSQKLGDFLREVPATKQLLILDSCRSGAAVKVVGAYAATRGGLEEVRSQQLLARSSGTFLIAATKGEEYAYEVPELGHGVLTYALLNSLGLLAQSSGPNSGVTANDLLRAVSQQVPELSEKYQGVRQQVVQYSSGQDFPLLK